MTVIYFCFRHKNRRKHNQRFRLLIFKINFRSSRPEVFCRKGVLRNFAKFTGKHLCQSLFFNKVAGLRQVCISLMQIASMNVFLFHVITGKQCFLYKFIVTQRFGATVMLLRSLKQVF